VIRDSAVIRLGGIDGMMNGPTTRGGIMVIKSRPFSLANFHAACSASVLETKYIWTTKRIGYLVCQIIIKRKEKKRKKQRNWGIFRWEKQIKEKKRK
jgi:hypothetical protein